MTLVKGHPLKNELSGKLFTVEENKVAIAQKPEKAQIEETVLKKAN